MDVSRLFKFLLYSGVAAVISAFLWILSAILINPWFRFTEDALSALGSPGANYPWVYNVGLMFTSILLLLYAVSLLHFSWNKVQSAGSSFLMIAALFLALIGIYHGGTYPHDFVSLWFFILADIAIIVYGIGQLMVTRIYGSATLVIAFLASALGFTLKWGSSAELETFGTCAISLWAILTVIFIRRTQK